MAKTKVNKSNLIREHLKKNPGAKANDVVAALKDMGHNITANLVYFLKGKSSAKKARKKRVVKAASSNGHVSKSDAITLIRDVRALAERAGGYDHLRELVDALSE
jgi:hypothetical protein